MRTFLGSEAETIGSRALLAVWTLLLARPALTAGPDFEREVAPILRARCLECHNANEPAGGLDLSRREGLDRGGDSGAAVESGNPEESLILQRVVDGEMPPKKNGKARPLAEAERERLRGWIAAGAGWAEGRTLDLFEATTESRGGRDWWSLQPVHRPEVPRLRLCLQPANEVDAFLRAKLEARGWEPAPPAGRRALIRRVCLDVTGLPPSFAEVEAFARDESPDAFERLVDRLLATPRFGERLARHWLDVARFAETAGYERDQPKPNAWKYRDWVIRAFNQDLPFDRFLTEQVAGDEVDDRSESTVTATGFLRLGTWNDEPNDPNEYKYERLEDIVGATSAAFLGLTVKCARCHDHKFDPIRQADYYRMASAFWAGPIEPGPRELLGGPEPATLGFDVLGWTDRGPEPPPLHLLKKGDANRPGPTVEPAHQSYIPALDGRFDPPAPGARTTGRRLQLARWMADPRNPLTARVWVNRIWQHYLGEGLVRSPDNFGFTGEPPTHPELLDWLADELVAGGWKSKAIHRRILLSETYRQASIHPRAAEYDAADAGNRLWWHASRKRLDAEALRDALLAASGHLDLARVGGPSFYAEIPADALEGLSTKGNAWTPSPPEERRRRALYAFTKRGLLTPFLTTFDLPDSTLPCGRRDVTLVAPQALALLNNGFVHGQSEAIADQVAGAEPEIDAQIRAAWRRTLAREPTGPEVALAREHVDRLIARFPPEQARRRALGSLCHVLLNSSEFLYID